MVNMKKAAFLLFCLFVVMLSGCSEALEAVDEFLLAMFMMLVGIVCAGGVCGAGLGFLLWWATSYKREAEKPKSLLVAILIGGIIGALGALPALYVMEAMF